MILAITELATTQRGTANGAVHTRVFLGERFLGGLVFPEHEWEQIKNERAPVEVLVGWPHPIAERMEASK